MLHLASVNIPDSEIEKAYQVILTRKNMGCVNRFHATFDIDIDGKIKFIELLCQLDDSNKISMSISESEECNFCGKDKK
jgi:hypothetical protein